MPGLELSPGLDIDILPAVQQKACPFSSLHGNYVNAVRIKGVKQWTQSGLAGPLPLLHI